MLYLLSLGGGGPFDLLPIPGLNWMGILGYLCLRLALPATCFFKELRLCCLEFTVRFQLRYHNNRRAFVVTRSTSMALFTLLAREPGTGQLGALVNLRLFGCRHVLPGSFPVVFLELPPNPGTVPV